MKSTPHICIDSSWKRTDRERSKEEQEMVLETVHMQEEAPGAETARLVKCLLHKSEDLSLVSTHRKSQVQEYVRMIQSLRGQG